MIPKAIPMITRLPARQDRLYITAIKENLLLFNAILCFIYAICYVLLVFLSFSEGAAKNDLYMAAVVTLNIVFLTVLALTLNTIFVVYRQITNPRKIYIRIACLVALLIWLFHIVTAYYFTFFISGFLTHFHQHIRLTFRTFSWPVAIIALSFSIALSVLFAEYYRQLKMKHVLIFIIPAIFQFSFKLMFPFLFFIAGWVFFGGCQLLLYFSILDGKRCIVSRKRELVIGLSGT